MQIDGHVLAVTMTDSQLLLEPISADEDNLIASYWEGCVARCLQLAIESQCTGWMARAQAIASPNEGNGIKTRSGCSMAQCHAKHLPRVRMAEGCLDGKPDKLK